MALKSPDMESCKTKQRCLSGPNEGLAYDPTDPCPSGTSFDSLKCDCVADYPEVGGYWRWTGTITTVPSGVPTNSDVSMGSGCQGTGSISCTSGWIFLNAGSGLTWKSGDSGSHVADNTAVELMRSAGSMTHVGGCSGGWNVANLHSITIETSNLTSFRNLSINGGGSSCFGGLGTTTTFSGTFQFSPNASESNITHTYTTPWPPA